MKTLRFASNLFVAIEAEVISSSNSISADIPTGWIDTRFIFSRIRSVNDEIPNTRDDGCSVGEERDNPVDRSFKNRNLGNLDSLPDEALFELTFDQLKMGADADIQPIKAFQGRFGPMGLGWARRKFGIPFSEALEIVTTAETDAWNYVLNSAPNPSLTAWRTRYFGVLQRQSIYQLNRQNRFRQLPDERNPDSDEAIAADSLTRDELASYVRNATPDEGQSYCKELAFVVLESQAIKKCTYCSKLPRLQENPPGEQCLLLWKVNREDEEDENDRLTWEKLSKETGLTVHHVRTAYAECQRRLRKLVSE